MSLPPITAAIVVVNVPDALAAEEDLARGRALIFAQLACGVGFPRVDRVERDGAGWRIRIVETAPVASPKAAT